MKKIKLIGYHATSVDNSNRIITDGFIINKNRKNDWLGHGIYLFEHKSDARSWATGTHYCKIDPSIIECGVEVEANRFLNLDDPEKMNIYIKYFKRILKILSSENMYMEFKDDKESMCWGLNIYKEDKLIDVVKYTFLNNRTRNRLGYKFDGMSYNYNEVQICVTENKSITYKELCSWEG